MVCLQSFLLTFDGSIQWLKKLVNSHKRCQFIIWQNESTLYMYIEMKEICAVDVHLCFSHWAWYYFSYSYSFLSYHVFIFFIIKSWNKSYKLNKNNFYKESNNCKYKSNYRSMNWTVIMMLCQMFRTNLYSVSAWSCSIMNISLTSEYKRKCGVWEEGEGLIIILLTNNLPVAGVHSILTYTWTFQVKLVWLGTSN